MLYFRTKPDPVWIVFVDQALRWVLDEIRKISASNDSHAWLIGYPDLGRIFTPYSALITLEALVVANGATMVYRLNDYHCLLVYECFKNYGLWHNDELEAQSIPYTVIGGYRFGSIEVETITERFFWDDDFITLLCGDTGDVEEPHWCSRVKPSNPDLAYGLCPHPDQLKLTVVEEVAWWVPDPQECGQWRLP